MIRRALAVLVLVTACGSAGPTAGSASHANAATAPTAAAPTPGSSLTFTGALPGTVTRTTAAGPCGPATYGAGADLRFELNGQAYALLIELPSYSKPGTYPLPPDRVSLHTLTIGPGSRFFGSQSGTVTVNADGRSGTVDAALAGNAGEERVSGRWSCSG